MSSLPPQQRLAEAVSRFEARAPELAAGEVVRSLARGLSQLGDILLERVHADVERHLGVDSMLAPYSPAEEEREQRNARLEIELYACVLVAAEVQREEYADLLREPGAWFLDWLLALRLGDGEHTSAHRRVRGYLEEAPELRRTRFASLLEQTLPEARKAPLVIYRLFSRAVRLATASAFCKTSRAEYLRREQAKLLPVLRDCGACQGVVMENGEACRACGNPLWKFDWLCSAD